MNPALIFCERSGGWCIALRRLLDDGPAEIVETRSLAECRDELSKRPASLLVLEATSESLPNLLNWLVRLDRDFPQARAAVVAERSLAEYELAVREAGALAMFTSPRQLAPLAAMAEAYLRAHQQLEPSVAKRVWSSLPWKPAARGTADGEEAGAANSPATHR